jgi:hypothetical protein
MSLTFKNSGHQSVSTGYHQWVSVLLWFQYSISQLYVQTLKIMDLKARVNILVNEFFHSMCESYCFRCLLSHRTAPLSCVKEEI